MFSKYLGQYLLSKGILTVQQLRDVIEQERSTKAKLGVLAMHAGLLTAMQVEEVHKLQWTMDRRFGEIAVSKGYLTEAKVNELISEQKNNHNSLSQVIVEKGYLTFSQLEIALENYKRECNLSGEQVDALDNYDSLGINKLSLEFLTDSSVNEMYSDYAALFLRNIIRFLNDDPVVVDSWAKPFESSEPINGWFITQDIIGSTKLVVGIVMDDDVLLELARRFSEEDLREIDPLVKDSVVEFFNVHNGIFLVNMSSNGTNLELDAPAIKQDNEISLQRGCLVPIMLSFGKIDLIIGEKVNR